MQTLVYGRQTALDAKVQTLEAHYARTDNAAHTDNSLRMIHLSVRIHTDNSDSRNFRTRELLFPGTKVP